MLRVVLVGIRVISVHGLSRNGGCDFSGWSSVQTFLKISCGNSGERFSLEAPGIEENSLVIENN
jgi:hypothetical protein